MQYYPNYLTGRTASFVARSLLRAAGCLVYRIPGKESPFDLVAWNDHTSFLLVTVRSSRASGGLDRYQKEIQNLAAVVRTKPPCGEVQFWLKSGTEWKRYRILSGGACLIPGEIHARV